MSTENAKSVFSGMMLVSVSKCQISGLNCHIGLPSVTQMSQLSYSSVTLLMKRVSKCFISYNFNTQGVQMATVHSI